MYAIRSYYAFRVVTPGYFEAAGIPLVSGRLLDATDRADAPIAVVVERRLAETLFGSEEAVGRRMQIAYAGLPQAEVVGVVADVRQYGLGSSETPGLYVSADQVRWSSQTFVLRTGQPVETLAPAIRAAVNGLDPQLPVYDLATIEDRLSASLSAQRFRMTLLSAFAGLALVLGT